VRAPGTRLNRLVGGRAGDVAARYLPAAKAADASGNVK
jgi:hypothetical protein